MNVKVFLLLVLLAMFLVVGCGCGSVASGGPRVRFASYPTATAGTNFVGPELGEHGYHGSGSERNGIAYTCAGGHIDISHLRKAADWTLFLAEKAKKSMQAGEKEFSFKLYEPSRYHVKLEYPADWNDLSELQREPVVHEMSVRLGQYFSFTATTWHEILSYFGYRSTKIFPEHASAFSWEDSYSNLLGTHLAAQVLLGMEDFSIADTNEYDLAMTVALDVEMEKLGVQSAGIARDAAASVRGEWFSGDLIFVNMKKRHFDVGVDDGMVSPLITAPGIANCGPAAPHSYPAPELDFASRLYGFGLVFEMDVREQVGKEILRVAYPDTEDPPDVLEPSVHFARIMRYVERDAIARGRTIPDEADVQMAAHGANGDSRRPGEGHDVWETAAIDDGDGADVDFQDLVPMSRRWLDGEPDSENLW